MNYLQSYLLDRINNVKIRIKQLEAMLNKCNSVSAYKDIENELHYKRCLLDEYILLYQLSLEG